METKINRSGRAIIFKDTLNLCEKDSTLIDSIKFTKSNQKIIFESQSIPLTSSEINRFKIPFHLEISPLTTLQAAKKYTSKGKKTCILNFASHKNPGGGVVKGSTAQEESICRVSTLYCNLTDENIINNFYKPHKNLKNLYYNDDLIFSPKVTVFKSEDGYSKLLEKNEWYNIDVISCSAPNMSREKKKEKREYDSNEILMKRGKKILDCAVKEKCDVIILGAFGCGVFQNPVNIVAQVFKNLLKNYLYSFENVEFAIYSKDDTLINIFKDVFKEEEIKKTEDGIEKKDKDEGNDK